MSIKTIKRWSQWNNKRLMGRCLDPKHCRLQHISHICQLWVAPGETAHMSGREDRSSLTLQTLAMYIWTHSKCAYWKLFITRDRGETDMSHMSSLSCAATNILLFSFSGCFFLFVIYKITFLNLYQRCSFTWISRPFHVFSISQFLNISFSWVFLFVLCFFHSPLSLHMYIPLPLGAVRANIDLWFGPSPDPPACTDWLGANLLLISWRDEVIALFSAYCAWWMPSYLYMLNFNAAVISFVYLDKHQMWSRNIWPGNLRHKAVINLATYFMIIKIKNQDSLSLVFKILGDLLESSGIQGGPRMTNLDLAQYTDWFDKAQTPHVPRVILSIPYMV